MSEKLALGLLLAIAVTTAGAFVLGFIGIIFGLMGRIAGGLRRGAQDDEAR